MMKFPCTCCEKLDGRVEGTAAPDPRAMSSDQGECESVLMALLRRRCLVQTFEKGAGNGGKISLSAGNTWASRGLDTGG